MKLSVKITALVVLLGVLFTGTSILLNQFFLQRYLTDSQTEWVNTLTRSIAEGISLDTINGNVLHARNQLKTIIDFDDALEYAYITDFNEKLFAHTFNRGFPRYLIQHLNKSQDRDHTSFKFITKNGVITEISIALIDGMRAQLHIGVNQNEITQLISQTKVDIFWFSLLITLLGTGIAILLGKRISTPLAQLSAWMSLYGKGENQNKLVLNSTNTEVSELVSSFNSMVDDRKLLERELLESEAFNRLQFETLPLGLALNKLDGKFVDLNQALCEILGRSSEEIKQMGYWDITPKQYAKDEEKQLQSLNTTGYYGPYEKEYIHADGHRVPVRLLGRFITRHGEKFIWSIIEDISERKMQDEQIRRSQKMDALGKLTGGIAHDYNNMLGVILGYSELLEYRLKDQPDIMEYIHEIRHAGERGASLTKRLLAFSRYQSSENTQVNLNTLLRDSQLMLEKTLTARISLNFDFSDDLKSVYLDAGDLEDAILNISINAMHAIDGNGKLTFQTRNELIEEMDAKLLQVAVGDYVLLSITDTGIGMDQETKEKIFDPFYSTKGEQGTGLGLSQVYGFIQRSNGSIKVYSEPGHGTRFTIYLPCYEENNKGKKLKKIENPISLSGNETVLVVDDEPSLTRLTTQILNQKGYVTLIANSAEEALTVLESVNVDLIISDVIMPDIDGYQLASIVQNKYPNIKIQLASGFSDDRHVEMVDALLHQNLLHKPYHSKTLLLNIRKLLDGD